MTIEDFLLEIEFAPEFVKEHIREWLTPHEEPCSMGTHCPISAIAAWHGINANCGTAWEAGKELNLSKDDTNDIINAADMSAIWLVYKRSKLYIGLIKELLTAVGVEYEDNLS